MAAAGSARQSAPLHNGCPARIRLGELDDQDGVLRGQADQHDQADLREDIVFHAAQQERQ